MGKAEFGAVGIGITSRRNAQKRTEREGCEVRRVAQAWRSEAGSTLLVLCKLLMEKKPAVGIEPTTA